MSSPSALFFANRTLELDETRRWTEGGALEVVVMVAGEPDEVCLITDLSKTVLARLGQARHVCTGDCVGTHTTVHVSLSAYGKGQRVGSECSCNDHSSQKQPVNLISCKCE